MRNSLKGKPTSRLVYYLIVLNLVLLVCLVLIYRWKFQILPRQMAENQSEAIMSHDRSHQTRSDKAGIPEGDPDINISFSQLMWEMTDLTPGPGDAEYGSEDYESAIASYLEMYAEQPDDEEIKIKLGYSFYGLGIVQYNQRDFEDAYASLSSAIAYYQRDHRFYAVLGDVLYLLKRYDEAEIIFTEGLKISDTSAELHYGLGKVKFIKKRYQDALPYLNKSLELNPKGLDTLNILGHVYFQLGDPGKARTYIQKALELQPHNEVLKKFLDRVEREYNVEKDFSSREGRYFIVKYDGEERENIGFRVERILQQARAEVGTKLGVFPDQPIPVILYSRKDFMELTRTRDWASGLYDGKIRVPIRGLENGNPNLRGILFHEYTHALVDIICKGNCPAWLNEGLAQYFDGRRIGDWRHILSKADVRNTPVKFYRINKGFTSIVQTDLAELAYAQSLLAVEYLYHRYSNREIQLLLADIGSGKDVEEILKERFRVDYRALAEELETYLRERL